MKILLVGINAKYIHSNLAIRSLRANAGEYRPMISLREYTINQRQEEILAGIYKESPDVIGFSCYLWNVEYVFSLAENIKKVLPDVKIIFGGPEVSYEPEQVFCRCRETDVVILGEGEKTFYEYLSFLHHKIKDLHEIDGLAFCEQGKVIHTAPRKGLDMEELVFPYEDLQGLTHQILYYESIRGCPFSCSYCLSSIEKTVRIKSVEKTKKERLRA